MYLGFANIYLFSWLQNYSLFWITEKNVYIIYLFIFKINILELNFKNWLLIRRGTCLQISVYSLPALMEVARLVSNWTLTDRLSNQTLPQQQFYFNNSGWKKCFILFHYLIITILVIIFIPYSPHCQCLNLRESHLY
jgi:hypothetical protein